MAGKGYAAASGYLAMTSSDVARISQKGERRWLGGHPWVYRSDLARAPRAEAGTVLVESVRGQPLGWALWSPKSEISLRLLSRDVDRPIDGAWWAEAIARAVSRREHLRGLTTACRLIHGEADGLPALVCDRYDRWLVVQFMSAGLEAWRTEIVAAILAATGADGILARNDAALRTREGLERETVLLHGDVPREVEVIEHGIRYLAAPWTGQKTGAFLDQRENRVLAGSVARGRALDCFSYHGSFALHLARNASEVTALDTSAAALERARANAALNSFTNVTTLEADAFGFLRAERDARARYDTIVLDPPAFAKTRASLPAALRGYKEINLRAMQLLAPGGRLFTASCSFHLSKALFLEMLEHAAADSGRRLALREIRGQPSDHPEIVTIPETGYIKGALLEALE